jgi:acetyltransferase-like isoleucine patch superfamily enzyme
MNGKKTSGRISGFLKAIIIPLIIFSMGFLPLVLYIKIIFLFIQFDEIWHLFLLPIFIYFGIAVTLFYQVIISGIFVHVFNIKYKPGTYEYRINERNSLRWILVCSLYTPLRKLIEIIPIGGLKNTYYRFLGMKIGNNTLVGGVIKDPCVTEFGNNVTMGEYAIIYGHIHNYKKGTLTIDRVKVGNNCVIGAGSIIMPGAVLEDDVSLAAGAVVVKGQMLKKGKIYAGIPAKEIKPKKK